MGTGTTVKKDPAGRVRKAIADRDWHGALALLRDLADQGDLSPAQLELLGSAAYGAGDFELAITAWERLHSDSVAAGEHVVAARAATTVAMYLMMDTGLMAPVRAWTSRAERLLDGLSETPVHAWLAMTRTYERLLSGDLPGARRWADQTIVIGERQAEAAPTTLGRIAKARLQILDGQVEHGLAVLDDAAVTIMSGAIDPLVVGMAYCELICAMQALAQYDRAEQWTDAMETWRHQHAVGGINGRCRVHRAEILRLRGSCQAAENEAVHACEELRPWMRREFGWPLTELGTIRLRRGDLAGAEDAFLDALRHGWDPQPGLALLRLAQGDTAQAVALIDDALERPVNAPSKERPPHTGLRRAPLLEAQTEIHLAAGEVETARLAAEELTSIAAAFSSRALTASAELAQGRVALARDQTNVAIRATDAAVRIWCDVGAPYEAGIARMVLADALEGSGNAQAARSERATAEETFKRIGAPLHVRGGTHRPPAGARPASTSPAQQVFRREGDTRLVVFDDASVRLRDLKGMRYLARLLERPGCEFHVLDLVTGEAGTQPDPMPVDAASWATPPGGSAMPILDAEARQAYKRRLVEIEEDIEEATLLGDVDRAALAKADRDYLVTELSRAVGLGGRSRTAASNSERARASVTRTLRYAMGRIAEHHPSLGEHLLQTVRTGTYCSYEPDRRYDRPWQV